MKTGKSLVTALVLASLASAPVLASTTSAPPGTLMTVHGDGAAIVIYNASPEVNAIVTARATDDAGKLRLERDALIAIASRLPRLVNATTITVRVIYDKSHEVSPTYNTFSYDGSERYANLTMSASDARADRDHWQEAAAKSDGPLPPWIAFEVIGSLPPRN